MTRPLTLKGFSKRAFETATRKTWCRRPPVLIEQIADELDIIVWLSLDRYIWWRVWTHVEQEVYRQLRRAHG